MARAYTRLGAVLLLMTALPKTGSAGTMIGWVEAVYGQMGSPLIETLDIYRSDGFILIDVAANYAAYAPRGQRLNKSQRENPGSVETESAMVVAYRSCAPQEDWLSGNISQINVKLAIGKAEDLAEELQELVAFSEAKKFKAWGFGASKVRDDQIFMGWNDAAGNSIEIQVNKQIHQLVWQIEKTCPEK